MRFEKFIFVVLPLLLIAGVQVNGQTTYVDNFNRASLGPDWEADPVYQIVSNKELDDTLNTASWKGYAIYLPLINPTEISYKWATSGDTEGANSGAIIMRYDRTLQSGYFILRRYGDITLHPIIGGIIKRDDILIDQTAPATTNPKPGDIIKVVATTDVTGHIFKFYKNGVLDGTVKDTHKTYGNGATLYGGLALYGQRNNNIDDFTVKGSVPPGPIASITVASPNGGETWYVGSSHAITWSSLNFSGNVKIQLSINGGSTYPTTVIASTANTGSYPWTVPSNPSTTCRIRISDAVDSDPVDISNANFTIAPEPVDLVITSPNGGEVLYSSGLHTITWTATVYSGTVKIELSTDGGVVYSVVTASTTNSGSYSWTVPPSYSTQCRIRISDTADGLPTDVSNANFEISAVPPDLQVSNPNGGENWIIGSSQIIRWTGPSASVMPYVSIFYSIDNGSTWTTIITSTDNDGAFTWTVPPQITTQGRIRVEDVDGLPSDMSDNPFSISALVLLQVKDASGQPGSTNSLVTIWLNNLTNVRGVSFRLTDSPNKLTATNVVPVGRATGFTVTRSENGISLFTFLVHMSGGVIPVGSGPIAQISYDVAGDASVGDFSDMTFSEVTVADAASNLVVPELVSGKFYFVIMGDMDADGTVNTLDIDRAVEIVMKTGSPIASYELMAGDLDHDGDFDLFDLLAIFDIVY